MMMDDLDLVGWIGGSEWTMGNWMNRIATVHIRVERGVSKPC